MQLEHRPVNRFKAAEFIRREQKKDLFGKLRAGLCGEGNAKRHTKKLIRGFPKFIYGASH